MEMKKIIAEVVREALPEVVRDLVRQELGLGAAPRARKPSLPVTRRKRRPSAAAEAGVSVGQRWSAKSYTGQAGRVIEIASLGKEKAVPTVVKGVGGRSVAKPISYAMLIKRYDLVE